ncbi:MAG: hypothetical protein ACFFEK_09000 [Candidatus Thorarchaeota archaeon]
MGLFGTAAPILVDINLILQYLTLVLLIVGYLKTKPRKTHGYLMMVVFLLTIGTTVFVMAPRILFALSNYGYIVLAHAGVGITAMLLGTLFGLNFGMALSNKQPLVCGSKKMMRVAFILWLLPILSGTLTYVGLYL